MNLRFRSAGGMKPVIAHDVLMRCAESGFMNLGSVIRCVPRHADGLTIPVNRVI